VWKGLALWKDKINNATGLLVMLIFNTVGILPIVYLKFSKKKIIRRNKIFAII
jgi:hypothetical protein